MTPIREEIVHIKGHPHNMIMFLHGYVDSAEVTEDNLRYMINNLDDVAIIIPQSPYSCELHPERKQWYSMHRFDPDDDRKTLPTIGQSAAVYDQMGQGLQEAYSYLNPYIEHSLSEYKIPKGNLFLCGFSQGATLAIYTALLRERKIKGCVSFSGMIAPHTFLRKNHQSTPDTLLIHGNADNLIRYEAMSFTRKVLKEIGGNVETHTIADGNHHIYEESLKSAVRFIRKRM